jgi:hypothetical protein
MIELPERAASLHVEMVICWSNGMVMVFDDQGAQMPALQGRLIAKRAQIQAVYTDVWYTGDWQEWQRRGIWSLKATTRE